jgi:glycosyltransferase involved in cell wall biosynthesis
MANPDSRDGRHDGDQASASARLDLTSSAAATPGAGLAERRLSVVVPCHNERDNLAECHRRVTSVANAVGLPYEIVLINDGSTDETWGAMTALAAADPHVTAIDLSRNHGHQLALSAGLTFARGDLVLIIDADLQDPPELLPEMLRIIDLGFDVVYGQRRRRDGESWFKRGTAAAFYRLLNRLIDTPIPMDTGDFRLMTRQVLDELLKMPEQHRFVRGMVSWLGFRQTPILYDRNPRTAGETSYSVSKMCRFAIDAFASFSLRPLRYATWCGLAAFIGGALITLAGLAMLLASHEAAWAITLAGAGFSLGGLQLLALGILGEYVGRLYHQSLGRPLFIVREVISGQFACNQSSEPLRSRNMHDS